MSSLLEKYKTRYTIRQSEDMTVDEYLQLCKENPKHYATISERMLEAIGDPVIVDTREDDRMSRIFMNRKIRTYPKAFGDFYGMEDTIEKIVSFFKHAAQGLEESKQVLYLLGPVGGGKSSLAERVKELAQRVPFYTIKAFNHARNREEVSPFLESPLGLFDYNEDSEFLEKEYGIARRYNKFIMSPWATKRLAEAGGDLSTFKVVKVWPSILEQKGITKVEPGDENNQDISSLVGKVNIRELEDFSQSDPDAYNASGGLNVTTQGVMEFVEMFKAPIKMLHPMLTATQEGHYNGTEQFGAMPYQGIIIAHSNESEWESFRNDRKNEAFLDRVNIIKVPYCLRVTEETQIYQKLISNSELSRAPVAPGTLEMMAQYSILTRIKKPEGGSSFTKMEMYDGKNMKDKDPKAKSLEEYREDGGINEGMDGSSTRFAYKILSKVFNHDAEEVAASPIHLMWILEQQIRQEQLPKDIEDERISFIKGILGVRYAENIEKELQTAYLESYDSYGQNLFDRYIQYADFWTQEKDYRDPDTGSIINRELLNAELEKFEKPSAIANPKDFRNEVVGFVLRASRNNGGSNPDWKSYTKLREVIEKRMFASTEELLPVISFNKKATEEEQKKHSAFIERMMQKGYTAKQVRTAVEWYMRYKKYN